MKRAGRTEAQIIGILQGIKRGSEGPISAPCMQAKHSGMPVSEAKRLKAREDENAKQKNLLAEQILAEQILAEQVLGMTALKHLLSKCLVRPAIAGFRG
ncbi:hypothetical protein [Cypionkella sp.]|uniref:hypothetical protein n=1 Tax=Cypionkella sp. TaxID=2811411 RepID=UPI00351EA531